MDAPSFKEDHISQLPAIQLLQKLGYTYLNPEQALELRGSKTTNVLLEDVLRKQLKEINSIKVSSTKTKLFNIQLQPDLLLFFQCWIIKVFPLIPYQHNFVCQNVCRNKES